MSEPIDKQFAEDLWAQAQAAARTRAANMPTEQSAIDAMFNAWYRLKELGWTEAMYMPCDGSKFHSIEPGSTGIHVTWRDDKRRFWCWDEDVYPASPVLYKAIEKVTP